MDKLLKGLCYNDEISVSVIESTSLINKAIKIHGLTPLTSAALGRTLTACVFMCSGLKNDKDKLSVNVVGDGVGGKITVCGNGKLQVRGVIDNPKADLPLKENGKLNVGGCVGKNGRITVIRSMGLKESYTGSSKLVSGEIAEDFTEYYAISEQQPTAMALGVLIGKNRKCIGGGGVVLQPLPFASEESIVRAEEVMKNFNNVSSLISETGAEGVCEKFFKDVKFTTYYPKYKCLCSRKYLEGVVVSLGKSECYDILEKEGQIKISCQFCNKEYIFTKDDINKLFGE